MQNRFNIKRLPLGETTSDGPFYAQVDGGNIGVNGRTHWDSEASARLAAETFLHGSKGGEGQHDAEVKLHNTLVGIISTVLPCDSYTAARVVTAIRPCLRPQPVPSEEVVRLVRRLEQAKRIPDVWLDLVYQDGTTDSLEVLLGDALGALQQGGCHGE